MPAKTVLYQGLFLIVFLLSCSNKQAKPQSIFGKISWTELASPHGENWHKLVDPSWNASYIEAKMHLMPDALRRNKSLAHLVINRNLKEARPYDLGALGKWEDANFFIAERSKIPNFSRLYWTMVAVLSKEYGCFMVQRITYRNHLTAVCRDGRQVRFKRALGQDWVQFSARQYDHWGRELIVKNHKIIRTGGRDQKR